MGEYYESLSTVLDDEQLNQQLKSANIMLVDDEPIVMEVIQTLLEQEDYKSFIALAEPRRTLDVVRQEQPDILLLDIKMPGISGFDILAALRADNTIKYIPVIMLTASDDTATKHRALQLGANDFLTKPVDASELSLRLRNNLSIGVYHDQISNYCLHTPADVSRSHSSLVYDIPDEIKSSLPKNNEKLQRLVEQFVRRLCVKVQEMENAVATLDYGVLVELGEWLKGSAATVGFDEFTQPARDLELFSKKRKVDLVKETVATISALNRHIVVSEDHRDD